MSNRRKNSVLLVGVWANRGWVLGNLLRELNRRLGGFSSIWWVFSVFARKSRFEKYFRFPLPNFGSYFFSYLTIFESYVVKNPKKFENKSLVFYPHFDSEVGSFLHQAEILNMSHAVYFMCKADAERLVLHGLKPEKVRIAYFGLDNDCIRIPSESKMQNTIVLASKYGPRKGLDILPEIVRNLPNWSFIALGRDWKEFIVSSDLANLQNFEYMNFNRESRSIAMSRASTFLSLSRIEGGPVPLIEAMSMGLIPIATRTGFAPDLIINGENGYLLETEPSVESVTAAIIRSENITKDPSKAVKHLTWDRYSQMILRDHYEIIAR